MNPCDVVTTKVQSGKTPLAPDPPPSSPVVRKQHSSVPRSEGQPYKTADPSEPQMPIREPLHRADDLKRHNKLQMKWQESMRKRLELGASAGDMDDIKDAL